MAVIPKQVVIYKFTSPTNKVYIGQSWNWDKRIKQYKRIDCKNQTKFYNSLLKYGFENHNFEIVHELPNDVSQEVLDNYEKLYWQFYVDLGFDILNCREPGKGGKLSKESIEKMLKTRGKWNHTEETKKSISAAHIGKKHTKETIAKLTGRKVSDEHLKKIRSHRHTDETKKKLKNRILHGKLVLDTHMGIFYESIALAAKAFNINKKTLHNRLTGISKNKTNLKLI